MLPRIEAHPGSCSGRLVMSVPMKFWLMNFLAQWYTPGKKPFSCCVWRLLFSLQIFIKWNVLGLGFFLNPWFKKSHKLIKKPQASAWNQSEHQWSLKTRALFRQKRTKSWKLRPQGMFLCPGTWELLMVTREVLPPQIWVIQWESDLLYSQNYCVPLILTSCWSLQSFSFYSLKGSVQNLNLLASKEMCSMG